MTTDVLDALLRMLGPDVGLGAAKIAGADGLYPEEAVAIASAVPKRQAEFAAGRRAARAALAAVGVECAALPVGSDRAPIWPGGTIGSISHDGDLALAAAFLREHAQSVGIDLTEAAALPDGVREQVLRHPGEAGLDELEARSAFSAKETLFKALSPHVGQVFGFSAVLVRPDLRSGTFEARLLHALGPFSEGTIWRGGISVAGDRLLTAMAIPGGRH